MEKLFSLINNHLFLRINFVGIPLVFLNTLQGTWLGAAWQHATWNSPFVTMFMKFLLFGSIGAYLPLIIFSYPIERWIIRDKAEKSTQWLIVRIVLYTILGMILGWGVLIGLRIGAGEYPQIVESSYFFFGVVGTILFGFLYSFLENALSVIRRREAELKEEVHKLRIEIDQARREKNVAEIKESEYFQKLQALAKEMKKGNKVGLDPA